MKKMQRIKEIVMKQKVLIVIGFGICFVLSYADNRQPERFQKADRAYTLMEQQNYAEAEPLMEQYLEISWEPYWKAVELVNGKINKFSRSEAEAALQKCKRMMKEES